MKLKVELFKLDKQESYEYIKELPLEVIQNKLDVFFSRSTWKSILDVDLNLYGKFTNPEKTEFAIGATWGAYTLSGGLSKSHFAILEKIDSHTTKIIYKNNSHRTSIFFTILGVLFFVIYFISSIQKPVEYWLQLETWSCFLAIFLTTLFMRGLSAGHADGIRLNFEKLLKTIN